MHPEKTPKRPQGGQKRPPAEQSLCPEKTPAARDHVHGKTRLHVAEVEFYDDDTFFSFWEAVHHRRRVPLCDFRSWVKMYFGLIEKTDPEPKERP